MSGCKYPNCQWDGDNRPHGHKRDMPTVTAISGAYDDGKSRSCGWAASLIAATTAVHEPERWADLGTEDCTHTKDGLCPACLFIRSEFDRVWNAKAELGSHVHHMALSWALGEEVEEDDTTAPYMDALAAFYQDCQPEWVELERTILYDEPKSHSYRGMFDAIADITVYGERLRWLLDFKTGSFYPASQTLQLSAYKSAKWLTHWENKTEIKDKPMIPVQKTGVILLAGDGTYRLAELPATGDAFGTFLRLRDTWSWHKTIATWIKEHPEAITTNHIEEGVAA